MKSKIMFISLQQQPTLHADDVLQFIFGLKANYGHPYYGYQDSNLRFPRCVDLGMRLNVEFPVHPDVESPIQPDVKSPVQPKVE
jgi:hypothetical protein